MSWGATLISTVTNNFTCDHAVAYEIPGLYRDIPHNKLIFPHVYTMIDHPVADSGFSAWEGHPLRGAAL